MQVLVLLSSANIRWPSLLVTLFDYLSSMVHTSCLTVHKARSLKLLPHDLFFSLV